MRAPVCTSYACVSALERNAVLSLACVTRPLFLCPKGRAETPGDLHSCGGLWGMELSGTLPWVGLATPCTSRMAVPIDCFS